MMANISNKNKCSDESKIECQTRETSYIQFMSSIPRLCSPTICGTVNYKTPKLRRHEVPELSFWSIEQLAVLNPQDFSTSQDLFDFHLIDEEIISKQLDEESNEFFSQNIIIPSPKTPEKGWNQSKRESIDSGHSLAIKSESMKTPDYHTLSRDSLVIDILRTPLNCSKYRRKKKLFSDRKEQYLLEKLNNSSQKDSLIDSQSLFSPIYSSNWRKNSLSHQITFLSPILTKNDDIEEVEENNHICNDISMKSSNHSYSRMTCNISTEPKSRSSIYDYLDNQYDKDFKVFSNKYHYNSVVLDTFMAKTSTPTHSLYQNV